jgi:hypothetical protein
VFRLTNALVSLLAVSSTRNSAELVGILFSVAGDACREEREEEADFTSLFVCCCTERGLSVWSVYLYIIESAFSFLSVVYYGVLIKNTKT